MTVTPMPPLPDEGLNALLAHYAAGHLPLPLHGLVAGHLVLKPDNRAFVAALETLCAQRLELEAPDAGIAPAILSRDAMLESIFATEEASFERTSSKVSGLVPDPISILVGDDLSKMKWRSVMPGLKEFRLPDRGECQASMVWVKAGRAMPSHTHEGTEITLVLKGGFTDTSGHYCRGDLAIADSDIDHRPRADEGEDCICFVVNDAGLRLTGPLARWIHKLTGH